MSEDPGIPPSAGIAVMVAVGIVLVAISGAFKDDEEAATPVAEQQIEKMTPRPTLWSASI